jgi:hypothetical protein
MPIRVPRIRNPTNNLLPPSTLNMPRTYRTKSFAPSRSSYSSVTFAPVVRSLNSVRHANHLLRNHPVLRAQFRHYLNMCSIVNNLETTIRNLERNLDTFEEARSEVFTSMTTPEFIQVFQPLLIQHDRRQLIQRTTPSAAISVSSSSDDSPQQLPVDQRPIPAATPRSDLRAIYVSSQTPPQTTNRTPTPAPIPIPIPGVTRFVSPELRARFNPCQGCGSNDGHFPGCSTLYRS